MSPLPHAGSVRRADGHTLLPFSTATTDTQAPPAKRATRPAAVSGNPMDDRPATPPATLSHSHRHPPRFVRAASVVAAVGEAGGKAAPPVQLPAQRGVVDAKRASDDLLARLVEARYAAGDRGGRLHQRLGAHSEVGAGANGPAPGHVRQLNAGTPHSVDRADGGREIAQGGAARPAQEDRGQRGVLLVVGPLIEVKADPPR